MGELQANEILPVIYEQFSFKMDNEWTSAFFQIIGSTTHPVECLITNKYHQLAAGQLCLIAPNEHIQRISPEYEPILSLSFQSSYLMAIKKTSKLSSSISFIMAEYAYSLLSYITAHCSQSTSAAMHTRLSCILFSLIHEFDLHSNNLELADKSNSKANPRKPNALPLIYATRYIKKNIDDPDLSLYEIASSIGYNPNYFCQQFSLIFNISPIKYLNNLRIMLALKYLEETDHSIQNICNYVGIRNLNTLSAMIKKKVNMTPSEYRRSCKVKQTKNYAI